MASIVEEQTVTDDTGTASPLTLTFGSAPVAENLLVAVTFNYNNGADLGGPGSWTEEHDLSADDRVAMFWKVAGASESSSHDFTASAGNIYGWAAEFSGLDPDSQPDGSNSATGVSSTPSSGNVTPSTNDSLALGAVGTGGSSTTATQPSGWTEKTTLGSSGLTPCYVATKVLTDDAALAYDPTLSGSDSWAAGLVVFDAIPDPEPTQYPLYHHDLADRHQPLPNNVPDGDLVSWMTAVRQNLEVLDAFETWEPEWTASTTDPVLGDGGTLVGDYLAAGGTFLGRFRHQAGPSTDAGSGTYEWALPGHLEFVGEAGEVVGVGELVGTDGTSIRFVAAEIETSTTVRVRPLAPASGDYNTPLGSSGAAWDSATVWSPTDTDVELRLTFAAEVTVFDPAVSITWDHFWFADGRRYRREGHDDGASVSSVPAEIGGVELSANGTAPVLHKAVAELGWRGAWAFSGAGEFTATLPAAITQPGTLVVVGLVWDQVDTGDQSLFDSNGRWLLQRYGTTPAWRQYAGTIADLNEVTPDGDAHVFVALFNGASSYVRVDGTEDATSPGAQGSGTSISIGSSHAQSAGTNRMTGWISAVGLYDGTLSDVDLRRLERWVSGYFRREVIPS